MPTELSDRRSLFLHVRTHPQLQYYFNLRETQRAANQSALIRTGGSQTRNVVEIHPIPG